MAVQYNQPGVAPVPDDPMKWVQDTGRQSYHYATIPEAYKNIPGFTDVANDPNQDPGAFAHNPTYAIELLYDSLGDLGGKVSVDLTKAKRP